MAIEASLSDGTVILIVRDRDDVAAIRNDDDKREVRVFMASEVARLIEHMPTLIEIKRIWPGATIKPTRFETPDYFWDHGDRAPIVKSTDTLSIANKTETVLHVRYEHCRP